MAVSKVTLTILCTVIGLIILGMYFEVRALSGGVGAFIVIALVYSFVVAKREAGLMAYALKEQHGAGDETRFKEEVIVPAWLQSSDSGVPSSPRAKQTTPEELQPSPE